MKIYCNFDKCKNYKELDDIYHFKYHKNYVPIGTTGEYYGECLIQPNFDEKTHEDLKFKIKRVICSNTGNIFCCNSLECLWNKATIFERHEICIDSNGFCVTYSDKKIKGHIDMMRFVGQGHSNF